jgi:hypothetical protein
MQRGREPDRGKEVRVEVEEGDIGQERRGLDSTSEVQRQVENRQTGRINGERKKPELSSQVVMYVSYVCRFEWFRNGYHRLSSIRIPWIPPQLPRQRYRRRRSDLPWIRSNLPFLSG